MRKIFPLGSYCFTNFYLKYFPQLIVHKHFYSPFNGCRIMNGLNQYFPQHEFLFNREDFLSKYYDIQKWEIVTDGQDVQALNRDVNLRCCHVQRSNNDMKVILNRAKASLDNAMLHNDCFLYVINMCGDFYKYYDFKAFQHKCINSNVDIVFLYQTKYKDYVDTTLDNAYCLGKEQDLAKAVNAFYANHADELLKRL